MERMKKYDEELEDIINKIPDYYSRRIILLLLILCIFLVVISLFIRYPDVLNARINILSENPSINIVSPNEGRITLFKENNDLIKKNEVIAEIDNPAKLDDILWLEKKLYSIDLDSIENSIELFDPQKKMDLGNVELIYSSFLELLHRFKMDNNFNLENQEIKLLKNKSLAERKSISENIEIIDLSKKKFILSTKKFKTDSILFEKKIITKSEFDKSRINYINALKEFKLQQQNTLKSTNNIVFIKDEINLKNTINKRNYSDLTFLILDKIKELRLAIKNWKNDNLISSPIDGKLEFLYFFNNNFYVRKSQPLFSIVPIGESYYGQAIVPSKGYGKINKGNEVKIKLSDYPYNEFGYLLGQVSDISQIAQDTIYVIKVELPTGLKSNLNKNFKFTHNMPGSAEIITQDKVLLERIFEKTIKFLDN